MTKPVKEVIPREIPENIKETINLFADTLEEVVNFGSHLLIWDDNPKTQGEENVAPTMLYRHFLDLIDSLSILIRHSCGDTSKLLIRGALEVVFAIEYLFEKDTHDRSMAFLVVDILSQIKTIKKYNSRTKEGEQLYKIFEEEKLITDIKLEEEFNLEQSIADKESVLRLPQFQKAYKEYERLKRKGERDIKWYRFFNGPRNIQELAKYLKKGTFYELLYRKWSGATHGSDIYLGKLTPNDTGEVSIVQLRFVRDVQEIAKYSMILSLMVMRLFIANRIPNRRKDLMDWYLTIRDRYFHIINNNLIVVR